MYISPSQVLLMLIKAYNPERDAAFITLEQLKDYYLSGFEVDENLETQLPENLETQYNDWFLSQTAVHEELLTKTVGMARCV